MINTSFSEALGRVVASVTGGVAGHDELTLVFEDGAMLKFYHTQDCCERIARDRLSRRMRAEEIKPGLTRPGKPRRPR